MKYLLFTLLLINFNELLNAQTIKEANLLYDNFEFELAAAGFEKNNSNNKLKTPELEKLALCYYYILNGEKGLPVAEELISRTNENLNYWMLKAEFEKITFQLLPRDLRISANIQ